MCKNMCFSIAFVRLFCYFHSHNPGLLLGLPLCRFPFRCVSAPPTHWRSICLADRNPYFSHRR